MKSLGLAEENKMQVRFKFNHWYPKLTKVSAITLYPYILFADSADKVSHILVRHEMIHVQQVRAMGAVQFYAAYAKQMALGLAAGKGFWKSYADNTFEVEAYVREDEPFTRKEAEEMEIAGFKVHPHMRLF